MTAKRLRCAATLSAILGATPASAQVRGPLSLAWEAPPGCPTRDDVVAAVTRLRPHAFQRPASIPVDAVGRVSRDGNAWSLGLDIRVSGDASERSVTADTCDEAADAAAVILALVIEQAGRREPERVAAPTVAPASSGGDGLQFIARLHGAVDVGTLPSVAPGLGASVGVSRSWLRVELGATWFPSQRASSDNGRSVDIGLVSGELRVCATPLRTTRLAAGLCAGLAGGVLYAQGLGFDLDRSDVTPWWSPLAGVTVNVRLWRALWALALVEAGVTLGAPRFVSGEGAELHRPSLVTARGTLGVELRLP